MTRRAHYLKPNKHCETVHNAIWFDTESKQEVDHEGTITHELAFGIAAYRRRRRGTRWTNPEWCTTRSSASFWDWVDSKCRDRSKLYLFCHNTSFDVPITRCFEHLTNLGFRLKTCVIDAPPTILKWRKGSRTIVLLDTLNIWRMPLKQLGQHIGLPKLDMPEGIPEGPEWDRYARRDVEIIMEACLKWWDMLQARDWGGFAPTLASQALRTYRHKYMHHPILIDNHDKALELCREAYSGGRVECMRLGPIKERIHYLDVNSMYPAVMQYYDYPTKLYGYTSHASVEDVRRWIDNSCVVAECRIETDEPVYAIKRDGKLICPVGRFRALLTTRELRYALLRGHTVAIERAACFHRAPIFLPFVESLYSLRVAAKVAGQETEAWLIKILLNSLYGKFGQRGAIWENVDIQPTIDAGTWREFDSVTGNVTRWRALGGIVQCQSKESEARDSHPAIAAHVTADARMLLWAYRHAAGHENVYYTDTDSLLVNDRGRERLRFYLDPNQLGLLKVEDVYTEGHIWGAKDYRLGDYERHKGVRASASWLDTNTVQQQQWSSLKGMLASGELTDPTTKQVIKRLKRTYSKGHVATDGRVYPLRLSEF